MFCSKCGAELKDGSVFCPKCGTKVANITGNTSGNAADSNATTDNTAGSSSVNDNAAGNNTATNNTAGDSMNDNAASNNTATNNTAGSDSMNDNATVSNSATDNTAGSSSMNDNIPDGNVSNNNATYLNPNSKKNSIIGMAAVGLVVLIVAAILLSTLFGGRSYEKVVKNLVHDMFTLDEKSIKDMLTLFPDEVVDRLIEEEDVKNKQELIKELTDYLKSQREFYDEQLKDISYKITDTEDFSKDEIDELNEDLADNDIKLKKKIKDAKYVKVKITFKMKDIGEESTEQTFKVMKIGRNWYLAVTDTRSSGIIY